MDGISYDFGQGCIALRHPADTVYLVNGEVEEGSIPGAVFFDNITGRPDFTIAGHWRMYF